MDAPFSYSDLEFAQITKAQDQNTFIDHKQSLCQMFSFESFFRYRIWPEYEPCIISNNDLELAYLTLDL